MSAEIWAALRLNEFEGTDSPAFTTEGWGF